MSVEVLIAYRVGCPHRARALEHILERHHAAGHTVIVGHGDETGSWVKAHAVTDALRRSTAPIVVLADADVWTDGLPGALAAVHAGAPWAIPHQQVIRLTAAATDAVIAGAPLEPLAVDERPYTGIEGGGMLVIRREDLAAVPLDPRFVGWGQEDHSHGVALRTLLGAPWRGTADLVHLWHPPQPRMTRRRGNPAGWELFKRYLRASADPTAMRALIQETTDDARRAAEPAGHDHQPLTLG